jgi:hypothetical protein
MSLHKFIEWNVCLIVYNLTQYHAMGVDGIILFWLKQDCEQMETQNCVVLRKKKVFMNKGHL